MSCSLPYLVSRETEQLLADYVSMLIKWQRQINLIGDSTADQIWTRHIADSLQLASILPPGGSRLDLGSGGGLPAVPLAIATGRPITLIESDRRKCIFLQEVKRVLNLPLTICEQRIEAFSGSSEIIIARACAPLHRLLAYSAPRLSPGGKCYFPKGRQYHKEIEAALQTWRFMVQCVPSVTDDKAAILVVSEIEQR